MKSLGVILNDKLRAADHVSAIINNCSTSLLYEFWNLMDFNPRQYIK